MIKSFKCADTQSLHEGRRVARFVNIERVALRKLRQLDIAERLNDLRVPPQNRLLALRGINGGCALCGEVAMRMMLKSWTITKRS